MLDQKEVTKRLFEYINSIGLNDSQLANEMGVTKQVVNQWKDNTSPIPPKRLLNFLSQKKEINANWFLYDRGDMFNADPAPQDRLQTTEGKNSILIGNRNTESDISAFYLNIQKFIEEKDKRLREKDEYIQELKDQIEFLKRLIKA